MALPKEDIVSPSLSTFAKGLTGQSLLFDVYLNVNGGQALVQGGGFGKQTINSQVISGNDQAFIVNTFNRLESLINLDIQLVNTENNSQLNIYYDSEISTSGSKSSTTLGLTIPNSNTTRNYSDIFINFTALKSRDSLRKYTFVHELGHALGLEHPFDNSDGDYYLSTDPYQSATPDESVMSYRIDDVSQLPSFYTKNDIEALISIWGPREQDKPINFNFCAQSSALDICDLALSQANSGQSQSIVPDPYKYDLTVSTISWESTINVNLISKSSDKGELLNAKQIDFNSPDIFGSIIQGGSGSDVIMGKAGWDILDGGAGNDLIHGGNGRDIITGGAGSDELWGDFGWNTYNPEKDGASDLIVIKSDQFLENWMYGKAGNNPNGEKADIIQGLDSVDQIRIVGVYTSDLTFSSGSTAHGVSGIGIYARGALEALYAGGDLSVGQIQTMTTGDASVAAMSNNINSYNWAQHPGTMVPS